MNKTKKEQKKEAEQLIEAEKQLNESMQRLKLEVETERNQALFKLVGASKAQELRDALTKTIEDQKTGDIRVTFAALDWLYRYYSKMNRIFKTGVDDYLE